MSDNQTVTADRVIARRSTADGVHVCLWSDGTLTWSLGSIIKGSANPRTRAQSEMALRAGWLVLGDVALYDADEVPTLIRAARATAKAGSDPGDMRARFVVLTTPAMPGGWQVISEDWRGVVTERHWRFPRCCPMRDLAILHVRGRYTVLSRMHGTVDVFAPTGWICETLGAAFDAVRTIMGSNPIADDGGN